MLIKQNQPLWEKILYQMKDLNIKILIINSNNLKLTNGNFNDIPSDVEIYYKYNSLDAIYNKYNNYSTIYSSNFVKSSKDINTYENIAKNNLIIFRLDVNQADLLNIRDIISLFDKNFKDTSFVIDPFFSSNLDYSKYNQVTTIINNSETCYLGKNHLSEYVLLSHLCNAFACSGHTCHQHKTNYPRDIFITNNGYFYIYHINLVIGNLANNDLKEIFS